MSILFRCIIAIITTIVLVIVAIDIVNGFLVIGLVFSKVSYVFLNASVILYTALAFVARALSLPRFCLVSLTLVQRVPAAPSRSAY